MIPDYLIIEEQLRREREEQEEPLQVPLHAPSASPSYWPEDEGSDAPAPSDRGAYIIDMNDYTVTRL